MIIFDNNSYPIIIDKLTAPIMTDHFWVLDLSINDFTLTPLNILEETTCPTMVVRVDGFEFAVPASWNILVCDRETTQLDAVEIAEVAGREFTAFVYGPTITSPRYPVIEIVDYYIEQSNISPALNKHQMMCHPIQADSWVCISPTDTYTKYLKNLTVGDLLG